MKIRKSTLKLKNLLIVFLFLVFCNLSYAQNAIVGSGFTSGWGGSCPYTGSADFEYFASSQGTSFIFTDNANGTGNQYFRIGVDWGGNLRHHTISSGSDVQISAGTEYTLNSGCTTSGSMYINVGSTGHNFVFKTADAGSDPSYKMIFFEVQGTVRTVSSVSRDPSGNVFPGQDVTITANLDGSFSTGQSVYLRYTTDNFTTSTIVEMSGSGTTYTFDIPGSSSTASAELGYYVFTSGDGLTISATNADWYSINLNNNSSSNYSYTVQSGWTTGADGSWSNGATWTASDVPSTTESMGSVTIGHDVTINQDAKLSSLTINTSKTLISENSGARTISIENGGTFTVDGDFTANDGTINFVGTGTISGTVSFNNVTINDGVNFGTGSTISGTLQLNVGSYVNTNCPTYGGSSTLKYNIGEAYNIFTEWTNTPQNVQISTASTDIHIDETGKSISGNLTIDASTILTVDAGKSLTVDGTITNNAGNSGIVIESNSSATGSLIESSGASATVKQYITGTGTPPSGRFWYGSPSVSDATSAVFSASGDNKLWYHTESSGAYTEITDDVTSLSVMKGYVARMTDNTTLSFTGTLNQGTLNIATSWNVGSAYPGFNLVGNPYPSAVDWESASTSNLRTTYWYRTYSGAAMVHDSYNGTTHVGTNNNTNGAIDQYLPPMQGFWVRNEDNFASGSIEFENADRSHQVDQVMYKNGTVDDNILRLRLERSNYSDETIIYFFENATNGFDDFDTEKMLSSDVNVPHLYTYDNSMGNLVMNGQPLIANNLSLQLGYKTEIAGNFAINAYNISDFDSDMSIYLEDVQENIFTDLRQNPTYNFNSAVTYTLNRFIIHFSPTITENSEIDSKKLLDIYSFEDNIYIKSDLDMNYQVEVFNVLGEKIIEQKIQNSIIHKIQVESSFSYYIVKVYNSDSIITKKVFIK
ncbi:MAG: T9SS type A sorting domain-containing protein [Bacteroidetes bacterium]|jgi:hypothetical protein|nr:T9SS type A sorting domain-containing protein [Bacteroidota bacterium]MBT6688157.1 T9SS type A sorting domain-containing protein [Bacteroidota bacterium]MBT7141708.1 T9SS type A sorting domain-containing protein [Bacteroidota bacterium]MBT7490208.1 T9SS type A sorting domain-containing protein [Bacteroidota bacterium]